MKALGSGVTGVLAVHYLYPRVGLSNICLTEIGSSLVTDHVHTHPFTVASPDPNATLTQTLTEARGGAGT